MDDSITPTTIIEIEAALAQVAEIKAARVVASPEGVIEEIHILALPSKAPKQLVRDIESTIMASFGIPVDHKKISIAQLGPDAMPQQSLRLQTRARIKSINAEVSGVKAHSTVSLEIDDQVYVGGASGPASQTGRQRMVAQATLNAIEQYFQGGMSFALEDVDVVNLGHEKVAVACVVLVTSFGEQSFSGSALMRQNEKDSICRATLDAINRRLGFLTTS